MGYDLEFVQIPQPAGLSFPLGGPHAEALISQATPIADPAPVRAALLKVPGCRPGPGDAVDYLGRGLSYARFTIQANRVHVENNCSASELLKVHAQLAAALPGLLIHDLQSRQLHTPESYAAWWARPL